MQYMFDKKLTIVELGNILRYNYRHVRVFYVKKEPRVVPGFLYAIL